MSVIASWEVVVVELEEVLEVMLVVPLYGHEAQPVAGGVIGGFVELGVGLEKGAPIRKKTCKNYTISL